jgi:Domain of unknown function (DUF4082)/PEP-CTERM motif
MKTLFCLAPVLAATLTAVAQGSLEAMLNYVGTTSSGNNPIYSPIYSSANRSLGWTFQPLANMDVTALGSFNYILPGAGGIQVGLWDSSGALLASETITASSSLEDQTLYESITPVMLTANQTYFLAAYSPAGAFPFYVVGPDTDQKGYATMSPEIQLGIAAYSPNAGFGFPSTTVGSPGDAVIAPNFQFQTVPEPSVLWLFGGGLMLFLITRRQNFKSPATGV